MVDELINVVVKGSPNSGMSFNSIRFEEVLSCPSPCAGTNFDMVSFFKMIGKKQAKRSWCFRCHRCGKAILIKGIEKTK